ncbi:hypothetical protein CHLRE_09g390800v5 [Chlamydomonas reinhardtii]|uniref:HNH domain-containing protein n=1 Tax=Chlamydomonas reinhardtii TaxID=3055 RepID=A0A2K3DDI0_CHLRE|nr:uncharacterized protein CHLRE_09g390800v5 [Chlamydomonas reinhardtii]PNW78591.1 hypothetical protein CHLRE_09g390800v5 [Chlamydomonas reinhardtii]
MPLADASATTAALPLPDDDQLRDIALAAVKESGMYVKDDWVRDFIVEIVVADVTDAGPPATGDDCYSRYSSLIVEQLPEVEDDEVRDFATALSARLAAAVEALAAEQRRRLAGGGGGSSEDEEGPVGGCALCGRQMPLTFHHLIPRDVHAKYKRKALTAEELNRGVDVCRPCHSAIHRTYDNKTLAASYSTLEALLQSEPLQKFIRWAQKQKVTTREDMANPNFRYRR